VLLNKVWGYLDTKKTRTLDIHVSKIRKKLEEIEVFDVIDTKRGVGYKYTENND
jgi:DNA-binding response OmpR family regulator